jgi:hypothetical protein
VALLYRSYKGYLFTRVTQSIITGNGQATSVYAYLYIYILYPYVLTLGKADTYLPDLTLCFLTLPCDEGRLPEYSIFEDHEEFKMVIIVAVPGTL